MSTATEARPETPTVSIVVPARNEARNLEIVLPKLPDVHEVIVVDGHSSDDTADVVARVLPRARFLQQTRKGKGNALAVGFEAATGDVVVMFDADGSADEAEIEDFVAALTAGADFAKGSRVLAAGGATTSPSCATPGTGADSHHQRPVPHQVHGPLLRVQRLLAGRAPTHGDPLVPVRDGAVGGRVRDRDPHQLRVAAGRPADPRGPQRRTAPHPR